MGAGKRAPFKMKAEGERVSGVFTGTTNLVSGKFAIIENAYEFTLVPWRPVMDERLGRQISGVVRRLGNLMGLYPGAGDWNLSDRCSVGKAVGGFSIHSREKRRRRVKGHDPASANHRLHPGLGVAPGALSLCAEVERSKIAQLDGFAANKRVGQFIEGLIENLASLGAGQRRATIINRRSQVVSRERSHSFAFLQLANAGS